MNNILCLLTLFMVGCSTPEPIQDSNEINIEEEFNSDTEDEFWKEDEYKEPKELPQKPKTTKTETSLNSLKLKKTCNLRIKPDGKIVTELKKGKKILVKSYNDKWYQVYHYKGKLKIGFIAKGCF